MWFWILVAQASPTYPAVVGDLADVDCDPPCTLCHETSGGGAGTVVTDLGLALMTLGLDGGGDDDALASLWWDVDSALLADESLCDVPQPTYGCQTVVAPRWAWPLISLGWLAAWRRRRVA